MQPRWVYPVSALTMLGDLPSESAGAVVIHPPADFGVGATDNERRGDEQYRALGEIAEQVKRVLRKGGTVFAMGDPRVIPAWDFASCWSGELDFVGEMVVLWNQSPEQVRRINSAPSLSITVRRYVKSGFRHTATGIFSAMPKLTAAASNVLVCEQVPHHDRYSLTQLPVQLFNYLISTFTVEDDLIVDPFTGTGSALVAAELNDRRWIGCDVVLDACKVARSRIETADCEQLGRIGYWLGTHDDNQGNSVADIRWIEG